MKGSKKMSESTINESRAENARVDVFDGYHPVVNLLYFAEVIGFSMFFIHPVCLGVSLICAFSYSLYINGKRALRFASRFLLPMLILTALINPAFNHRGVTILLYLPGGNPLTLESILYGIAAATMLITVVSWFSRFNAVITSDKLVYLFGSLAPALSLILTMSLRLIPRYRARLEIIANARERAALYPDKSFIGKISDAVKNRSIMVTWAIENSVETADSMRARGYGLPGRTAFSIYHFDGRDKKALLYILGCGALIFAGSISGAYSFRYFPSVKGEWSGVYAVAFFLVYFLLCAFPLIINIMDDILWKSIESKI